MFKGNIKIQFDSDNNNDKNINNNNNDINKKNKFNILNSPYLFLITFSTLITLVLNMPELNKKQKNKYGNNIISDNVILNTNDYILAGIVSAYIDKLLNNTSIVINNKEHKQEIKKEITELLTIYIYNKIALNLPSEKERHLFYIMIKENVNEEHVNSFLRKHISNLDEIIVDAVSEFESNFLQDIKSKNNVIQNKKVIRNI